MIWNIKVWQTCKKIKNQEGGQHFFTPLYIYILLFVPVREIILFKLFFCCCFWHVKWAAAFLQLSCTGCGFAVRSDIIFELHHPSKPPSLQTLQTFQLNQWSRTSCFLTGKEVLSPISYMILIQWCQFDSWQNRHNITQLHTHRYRQVCTDRILRGTEKYTHLEKMPMIT